MRRCAKQHSECAKTTSPSWACKSGTKTKTRKGTPWAPAVHHAPSFINCCGRIIELLSHRSVLRWEYGSPWKAARQGALVWLVLRIIPVDGLPCSAVIHKIALCHVVRRPRKTCICTVGMFLWYVRESWDALVCRLLVALWVRLRAQSECFFWVRLYFAWPSACCSIVPFCQYTLRGTSRCRFVLPCSFIFLLCDVLLGVEFLVKWHVRTCAGGGIITTSGGLVAE